MSGKMQIFSSAIILVFLGNVNSCSFLDDNKENSPPTADAGADRQVLVGNTIQLDGSGSDDADGDPLSYEWPLLSRPSLSEADLSGGALVDPEITVDVEGNYEISLVVNDGTSDSAPDTVVLTASAVPGATLLRKIPTGFAVGDFNHGMAYCDDVLYVTSQEAGYISKISLTTNSIASGYPTSLSMDDYTSGVAVDPSDHDSLWVCEINDAILRNYDSSITFLASKNLSSYIATGLGDVAVLDGYLYAIGADSESKPVVCVAEIASSVITSFQVADVSFLPGAVGWKDLSISDNKLYIACGLVHDGKSCVVRSSLDGSTQEIVSLEDVEGDSWCVNAVSKYDDKLYLNARTRVFVTDLSGVVLNYWDIDMPDGFTGIYERMEVLDGKIYIASSNPGNEDTEAPHLLVYEENQGS